MKLLSRKDVERAYPAGVWPQFDEFGLDAVKIPATDKVAFNLYGRKEGEEKYTFITRVYAKNKLKTMTGTN